MITIHRVCDGVEQASTYTVEELITELKKYSPHTPVIGEWDGFGSPIDSIKLSSSRDFFKERVVVLDVSEQYNLLGK